MKEVITSFPNSEFSILRDWLQHYERAINRAMDSRLNFLPGEKSFELKRGLGNGRFMRLIVDLTYFNPKQHRNLEGFGEWKLAFKMGDNEPFVPNSLRNGEFERLDILERDAGIRFVNQLQNFPAEPATTLIDPKGNILTSIPSPVSNHNAVDFIT